MLDPLKPGLPGKIVLRFTKQNSPIAAGIRFLTWSEWSHVEVLVSKDVVFSSDIPDGVRFYPPVEAAEESYVAYDVKDLWAAFNFASGICGEDYDYGAIFGFLSRRDDWQDPGKWFCSEAATKLLMEGGCNPVRETLNRISPGVLYASGVGQVITKEEAMQIVSGYDLDLLGFNDGIHGNPEVCATHKLYGRMIRRSVMISAGVTAVFALYKAVQTIF